MREILSHFILICFVLTGLIDPSLSYAQAWALPVPGVRVALSSPFNPPILKGIKIDPNNPFRLEFVLDRADSGVIPAKAGILDSHFHGNDSALKQEANKLIKYFLASLTVPENDLWVNLSPYEKNRIIPTAFGQTEMGRDLLAQDYMLKQITASLIYPEDETGKKFWKRIYEEAQKKFGTTNIPVNTFNKVWIVPEKVLVYENKLEGQTAVAYVVESRLKVMLEEDYTAFYKNAVSRPAGSGVGIKTSTNALASQIIREIVIPQLTREINEGKNFAQLRQVYHSLILATWYKRKIKNSILAQVYADQNKISGLSPMVSLRGEKRRSNLKNRLPRQANSESRNDTEEIYNLYLQAFKKGVYNYIKEEKIPYSFGSGSGGQTILRKYFSGGCDLAMRTESVLTVKDDKALLGDDLSNSSSSSKVKIDLAMLEPTPKASLATLDDVEELFRNVFDSLSRGHQEYFRRFVRGVSNSQPTNNLSLKPQWDIVAQERIKDNLEAVLKLGKVIKIMNAQGKFEYWIAKERLSKKRKKHSYQGSRDIYSDGYDRLAYLIGQEIGVNVAESRDLTPEEARDLNGSIDPKSFYIIKVIDDSLDSDLILEKNRSKAFSSRFVMNVLLFLMMDPWLHNLVFSNEIPFSIDHEFIFPSLPEAEIWGNILHHYPLTIVESMEHMQGFTPSDSINAEHLSLVNIIIHGLGNGLIAAEELNPKYIAETITKIKSIPEARWKELINQSSLDPSLHDDVWERLKFNRGNLDKNLKYFARLLTGNPNALSDSAMSTSVMLRTPKDKILNPEFIRSVFLPIEAAFRNITDRSRAVIVSIEGLAGSGKNTVGEAIQHWGMYGFEPKDIAFIDTDDYMHGKIQGEDYDFSGFDKVFKAAQGPGKMIIVVGVYTQIFLDHFKRSADVKILIDIPYYKARLKAASRDGSIDSYVASLRESKKFWGNKDRQGYLILEDIPFLYYEDIDQVLPRKDFSFVKKSLYGSLRFENTFRLTPQNGSRIYKEIANAFKGIGFSIPAQDNENMSEVESAVAMTSLTLQRLFKQKGNQEVLVTIRRFTGGIEIVFQPEHGEILNKDDPFLDSKFIYNWSQAREFVLWSGDFWWAKTYAKNYDARWVPPKDSKSKGIKIALGFLKEVKGLDLWHSSPRVESPSVDHDNVDLDNALMSESKKGGIDLKSTEKNLKIQSQGDEIVFNVDPVQLARFKGAQGFVPVIIDIQPLKDVKAFLGAYT